MDESRENIHMPGGGIVLLCKSDAVIVLLAVIDRTLVMIQRNVCACAVRMLCSFALE